MRVDRMTMTEFEQAVRTVRVALVPFGSVEEHGRHLPLCTDTLQVWQVALEAARRVPFLVCPPVHYGYCRSTRDHPGTLSIRPSTLRRIAFDLVESLHRQGVRGVILASGHAGGIHMAALEEAAEALADAFPDLELAVVCEYRWAQEAGRGGVVSTADDGHAGEIETSRVQALAPDLVKGLSPEEYPRFEKPFVARDKRAQWPGGVWGNPAAASPEKGRALFEASVERLVGLVTQMRGRVA
ncbi:creatininase family protein [Deferrisoma camini]|uniref:creatininase family protein n=1 Tax=Deferrisoma camini TaxID=1035120 RepID=UPI00046CED9A|nr:creatininase family protein [Deferrisoma camini]